MKLRLHIEELVLQGFEPGDRYGIAEALEHELTSLFLKHGIPPSLELGGEVERIDAGSFDFSPGSKVETIGSRVAQSVYGGLKR